jgi:hypothetical protein
MSHRVNSVLIEYRHENDFQSLGFVREIGCSQTSIMETIIWLSRFYKNRKTIIDPGLT